MKVKESKKYKGVYHINGKTIIVTIENQYVTNQGLTADEVETFIRYAKSKKELKSTN